MERQTLKHVENIKKLRASWEMHVSIKTFWVKVSILLPERVERKKYY